MTNPLFKYFFKPLVVVNFDNRDRSYFDCDEARSFSRVACELLYPRYSSPYLRALTNGIILPSRYSFMSKTT